MRNGRFAIGAEVSCTDGACGKLSRVVVDPVARVATHLIVEPRRGHEAAARSLGLVDSAAGEIQLNCTSAEFDVPDPAEQTRFITEDMDVPNYRTTDVLFGLTTGTAAPKAAWSPRTRSLSARWRYIGASTFMPATDRSAWSRGWSSILAASG